MSPRPPAAERIVAHTRGYAVGTEAVIPRTLLGVCQDLVSPGDLLESRLGCRIGIGIGVELACPLAVGALDLVGRRVPIDAQQVVVVVHPRPTRR